MSKGIFFIPVFNKTKPYNEILDEVTQLTISAEKMGLKKLFMVNTLQTNTKKLHQV